MLDRTQTVRFGCGSTFLGADAVIGFLEEEEGVPTSSVKCVQQLADRSVLVTFASEYVAEQIVGMDVVKLRGIPVVVSWADRRKTYVKVHYLPYEVPNEMLLEVLKGYGHVYSIRRDSFQLHGEIETGTRTVTMTLREDIPSYLQVGGCTVKTYFRGQKMTCRVCGGTGHIGRKCPDVRCYNCGEYGHMAASCPNVQCSYCYDEGHNYENCQSRLQDAVSERDEGAAVSQGRSYAQAASVEKRPVESTVDRTEASAESVSVASAESVSVASAESVSEKVLAEGEASLPTESGSNSKETEQLMESTKEVSAGAGETMLEEVLAEGEASFSTESGGNSKEIEQLMEAVEASAKRGLEEDVNTLAPTVKKKRAKKKK